MKKGKQYYISCPLPLSINFFKCLQKIQIQEMQLVSIKLGLN